MAKAWITGELWKIIETHLPVKPRKKYRPGHKPLPPGQST